MNKPFIEREENYMFIWQNSPLLGKILYFQVQVEFSIH